MPTGVLSGQGMTNQACTECSSKINNDAQFAEIDSIFYRNQC